MDSEHGWSTDPASDARLPLALYRAFSACLLAMGELARQVEPDSFLREALFMLRGIVPFDSAWWGEVASGSAGAAPRNLLHASIGLSASFADEWNRTMAPMDSFAHSSMARLGTVFRASGGYPGPPGDVADFIDRHKLHTIMAITVELPDSGLLFFVALYRDSPHAPFSDMESVLFQEFVQHLVQLWRHRLADLHETISAPSLDAFALADRQGRLFYLGRQVGTVLQKEDGNWRDGSLPAALLAACQDAPCSIQLGGAKLVLEVSGKLVAIILVCHHSRRAAVSPRELSAAMLFAQGHSYKEIARLLCLTPATVRTYLRNAYNRLGVTNKVELISALSAPMPGQS
ncbi:MAG: helix-turn-helix transcriptional regulator [Pseudomonadota bacterium]